MDQSTARPIVLRPRHGRKSEAPSPSRDSPARGAYSIFHEPWWLDTVAPSAWHEAKVETDDGATARWPFFLRRRWGLPISCQPPLTRTLGPVMSMADGKQITDLRRRLRLTRGLIDQLPRTHLFQQTFDARITEAVAFRSVGFSVNTAYTFRIEPSRDADDVWTRMTDKTRNVIRRAAERTVVVPLDDPEQFCTFYDTNLTAAGQPNIYGTNTMRRLANAFMARAAGCLLGAKVPGQGLVAAIAVVWDAETTYFLLSSRTPSAHSGAISLLLWHAIQQSLADGRGFDFDGIANASILQFLSGFGGTLAPRLVVERSSPLYDSARLFRRLLGGQAHSRLPI